MNPPPRVSPPRRHDGASADNSPHAHGHSHTDSPHRAHVRHPRARSTRTPEKSRPSTTIQRTSHVVDHVRHRGEPTSRTKTPTDASTRIPDTARRVRERTHPRHPPRTQTPRHPHQRARTLRLPVRTPTVHSTRVPHREYGIRRPQLHPPTTTTELRRTASRVATEQYRTEREERTAVSRRTSGASSGASP